MAGVITKSELADKYGITVRTLGKLLNQRYFERLQKVGYQKQSKNLSPKVINEFYDIYGKPLTDED